MNNFIFFTDSHLRLTPTKRRTDNMFEAQLAKLEWIGKRASELGSLFVVCGGDLGDSWDWKISMVNRVAEVLKKYPCPIYTIIGNHDVPGRNPELWKDTGLGLLDSIGAIRVLHPNSQFGLLKYCTNQPNQYEYLANVVVDFQIVPFHSDTKETDDLISGKYSKRALLSGGIRVAIIHAPVGAETTPFCKGHKELFINDFDVALFGDIHDGWAPYNSITGCVICNPGSLTRLTKKDMSRNPQIAVVYSDKRVEYEDVTCTLATDCFDTTGIEAEKQELGKGFLAAMAAKNIQGDIDPKEYISEIGTKAGYSEEAITILKNEL